VSLPAAGNLATLRVADGRRRAARTRATPERRGAGRSPTGPVEEAGGAYRQRRSRRRTAGETHVETA
jgi:hypothetical protein